MISYRYIKKNLRRLYAAGFYSVSNQQTVYHHRLPDSYCFILLPVQEMNFENINDSSVNFLNYAAQKYMILEPSLNKKK